MQHLETFFKFLLALASDLLSEGVFRGARALMRYLRSKREKRRDGQKGEEDEEMPSQKH